jgi:hypothetical protein
MGQHMLGLGHEDVGAKAEVVVSQLIADAAAYHHTLAAVAHNLLENKAKLTLLSAI